MYTYNSYLYASIYITLARLVQRKAKKHVSCITKYIYLSGVQHSTYNYGNISSISPFTSLAAS